MVEQIGQEPQAELEQAQVTAVRPMNDGQPVVIVGHRAQANDPQIGQAGGDQQSTDLLRIAHMAAVDLKTPAFLVRKEGFDVHPFAVPLAGARTTGHVAYQINRLGRVRLPPGHDHHRAVGRRGEADILAVEVLPARHAQIRQGQPLRLALDENVFRGAADVLPVIAGHFCLQLRAIEFAVSRNYSGLFGMRHAMTVRQDETR